MLSAAVLVVLVKERIERGGWGKGGGSDCWRVAGWLDGSLIVGYRTSIFAAVTERKRKRKRKKKNNEKKEKTTKPFKPQTTGNNNSGTSSTVRTSTTS